MCGAYSLYAMGYDYKAMRYFLGVLYSDIKWQYLFYWRRWSAIRYIYIKI